MQSEKKEANFVVFFFLLTLLSNTYIKLEAFDSTFRKLHAKQASFGRLLKKKSLFFISFFL